MRGLSGWVLGCFLVAACSASRVTPGPGGAPPTFATLDLSMNADLAAQPAPPDLASAVPDLALPNFPSIPGEIYGHSFTELYRIDTATGAITWLGPFVRPQLDGINGGMEDIAIDQNGLMVGTAFEPATGAASPLYWIDYTSTPGKAICHPITLSAPVPANGLTFLPAGLLDPTKEVLLASGTSWWRIDLNATTNPTSGIVTTLASLPAGWMSVGGDSVGIIGDAVYTTAAPSAGGTSHLLVLDPVTMNVTDRGDTGELAFWGLAYWAGRLYGFSYGPLSPPYGGQIFRINTMTAQVTQLATTGLSPEPQWYGAAVKTSAPRM